MKKILVMSDSHGDYKIVKDLYNRYKDKVDFLFHNGDSELSSYDRLWRNFFVVGGNNDFSDFKDEQLIILDKDVILQTHGHHYGINFGLEQLYLTAKKKKITIVLFGHLHRYICEKYQGILLVNPGSITQPRGIIQEKSYAILDLDENVIKVQYYNRNHQPLKKLYFEFLRVKGQV
ncbi:MAG: metallophosphoesterase [Streptococcaceae bacterium]|jgi:putative phosphoesterase|nr:metallophosphoesterase [Streptococcaceae bacterium]